MPEPDVGDDRSADFDSPWKELIGAYLQPFMALFFPTVHERIDGTLIHYLGHRDAVGIEALRQAVRHLVQDPARRQHLAAAGMALVDGQGAARVVQTMQTDTGGGT